MNPKMSVIVAHPGRQHSHHHAYALDRIGVLKKYYTQKPPLEYLDYLPSFVRRAGLIGVVQGSGAGVSVKKIRLRIFFWITASVLSRLSRGRNFRDIEFQNHKSFDRWVAGYVRRTRPKAVVGYETSCAESFAAAREVGALCILDAASLHFRRQDEMLAHKNDSNETGVGREIRLYKEREIDLADWIFCASPIAKDSYVDNGVPAEKIVVQALGCDLEKFFPGSSMKARSGSLRIAFVGKPAEHKGFRHLLAAAERVWKKDIPLELHVFGDPGAACDMGALPVAGRLFLRGAVSHEELARNLREMDCLVLPSLFDSFALVVIEAMATGLPCVVSEMVGAKMAIKEGETGWIVPVGDVDRLAERMTAMAMNPASVRNMSSACVEAASFYGWDSYYKRIQKFFSSAVVGLDR